MKRRALTWMLLVFYVAAACGSLTDAGCCHERPEHSGDEHGPGAHVHSKTRIETHALLQANSASKHHALVNPHCCCVCEANGEPGMLPHTFTRQSGGSGVPNYSAKSVAVVPPTLFTIVSKMRFLPLTEDCRRSLVIETVISTVLII